MINDQLEDFRITNLEEVCMFQQINYEKLKEAYILQEENNMKKKKKEIYMINDNKQKEEFGMLG